MLRLRNLLAGLVAIALCAATGGAFAAAIPDSGELNFTVVRDGDDVGTHKIAFRQVDGRLEVDVVTEIKVKMFLITVFRFEYEGHEIWREGQLVSLVAETNDDGDDHVLDVHENGAGALEVIGDGVVSTVEKSILPASLWNPQTVKRTTLLNSLKGGELAVSVQLVGEETIDVKGKPTPARHFSMTGDFERELWYDEDWILVKLQFLGKDGSDIQYVLR